MNELSIREKSLLQDVAEDDALSLLFFRNLKGLKWFDTLCEKGYFAPQNNPKPVLAQETGYVNIPYWIVTDYLVKTATELSDQEDDKYAHKFVRILVDVTEYAKKNEYSNYRTWWKFSKILENIPPHIIQEKDLDVIDYWLDDKYQSDLIVEQIGMKWLVSLLNSNEEHAFILSRKILSILYRTTIIEDEELRIIQNNALFRFDKYYAQKITNEVATLAGGKLGEDAIFIFEKELKNVLEKLNNDSWSSLWQPAIENHKQNEYRDEPEHILIQAYRDSLDGHIKRKLEKTYERIKSMLDSEYQTIHRLAIHSISNNYPVLKNLTDTLLNETYFSYEYQHEMWNFLHENYQNFNTNQKEQILKIINGISKDDGDGNPHEGATGYNKACWLDAIKSCGDRELNLYETNLKISKTERLDHPDFSSYTSQLVSIRHKSPFSIDELGGLSVDDLIVKLKDYNDSDDYSKSGFRGLYATLNQLVKREPHKFYLELNKFVSLDLPYVYEIILAYNDLWTEKAGLPWDDVWHKLLQFFETVIEQSNFWNDDTSQQPDTHVTYQDLIVSSISQLIESGTQSDDHAFSADYLEDAKKIIEHLLYNKKGDNFNVDENAVTIAINSHRGHCLEALINLGLRSCRLSDKREDKDHSAAWKELQPTFDAELRRADAKNPEYEFITLVVNCLPQFLYMSKEWVLDKLDEIFDRNDDLKWSCAMQGYAYVNRVYPEIYHHLKFNGHFLRALDDKNIKENVTQKVIQNVAIAFLDGLDELDSEDNLIDTLIERNESEEINYLIWFIWILREGDYENLSEKVFILWPKILANIDLSTGSGQKTAAQLCCWVEFINKIEESQKEWLHKMAPYVEAMHDGYRLLENLSRLSEKQPFESQEIWLNTIGQNSYPYPEGTVKKFLKNIVDGGNGKEGEKKAQKVIDQYLQYGETRPIEWLEEIMAESKKD